MKLTGEGTALLRYCRAVLELEGEVLAGIEGHGSRQATEIGISGPTSMIRHRVIAQSLVVLKEHPNLAFHFDVADDGSQLQKLRTGVVELAIIPQEEVTLEMDSKVLKDQRYVLVGPAAWKHRDLKEIVENERIVDFNPRDDMTVRFLKECNLFHLKRPSRHFVNNTDGLAEMVVKGAAYSTLPEKMATPLMMEKKIVDLKPGRILHVRMALAWYPRQEMPAYFKAIVKAIR